MKKAIILLFFVAFISCDATKRPVSFHDTSGAIISGCPETGNCSVKVFPNMAMETKMYEGDNSLHYEKVADSTKSIIVYTYERTVPKGVMDAGLREEVAVEIDNAKKEQEYDFSAQSTKALFGRFCYCKGFTGYYKINAGRMKIETKDGIYVFNLDFKVEAVPQVSEKITFSIQ